MSDIELGQTFDNAAQADWLAAVEKALGGKSYDTLVSNDLAGYETQPLYTEAGMATGDDASGLPGQFPFLRGARALNNKFLPWQIAARIVPGRRGNDNAEILADLTGGVSALHLDFASAPNIDSAQIEQLLDGVMFDIAPLTLTPGRHAAAALQLMATLRADNKDRLAGYANIDPLGTQILYGDSIELDYKHLIAIGQQDTKLRLMTANGAAFHAAGAGIGEELGWALAALTAYLRAFEAAGLAPEDALPRITMTLAADGDFFASLAKMRAARLLFANIAKAAGSDAAPQIHAETGLRAFSDLDPWVNILRGTIAAMATGIAGIDMFTAAPCTASAGGDNALTRRIARNTQIILQEESRIGQVADAAGGSWYVESLTRQFAEAGWAEFQKIEAEGGLAAAIANGKIAASLDARRAAYDEAVGKRQASLVGVSAFPNLDEAALDADPHPPANGYRLATRFEDLRRIAAKSKPRVFLACLGTQAAFTARANFAANLYAAGGVQAQAGDGGTDIDAIVAAFRANGSKIVCLCGSDEDYDSHAEGLAQALYTAGAVHIALAGQPRGLAQIDDYCFAGCAALDFLSAIHDRLGLGD